MQPVDRAVEQLDAATAGRVRPALSWLRSRSGSATFDGATLRDYLAEELPRQWHGRGREQHEVAWALADVFEHAGLLEQAALCRSAATHEHLAVRQWTQTFTATPASFWDPALEAARDRRVPPRALLSLSSAQALLETVGTGLTLTADGQLPLSTVLGLDDRFRWTEEFPWMRAREENDVAPLRLVHSHLLAQRLLVREGGRLRCTPYGASCAHSTDRLWHAVVDPGPRWSRAFDRDAIGVLAATVLRFDDVATERTSDEVGRILAGKWHTSAPGERPSDAAPVTHAWYQLGVPLGWWDTGRGLADRRPSAFGRAAAAAAFRAGAGLGARQPGASPPAEGLSGSAGR